MKRFVFVIACLISSQSWAQLWEGTSEVIQQDLPVGMVWVAGSESPCRYTEYWFLGPDYVYPGTPRIYAELLVKPDESGISFETPQEFFDFARAVFPGGKRVISEVVELENCGPCSASAQFQFEMGSLPCDY